MTKTFPIDFVRQIIEQTLFEEHINNPSKYFGGRNQVNLFSFYEQLQKDDEVDRYVECYRDLVEQQNRSGIIMNGTIIAPENPTITNLYKCLIIPMSFTCSFRVKLGDRDSAIETINNLIETLKGRKCDVAESKNGRLLKVGTIGNEIDGKPEVHNGDFIVEYISNTSNPVALDTAIETKLSSLLAKGIEYNSDYPRYLYYSFKENEEDKPNLYIAYKESASETWKKIENQSAYPNIIIPKDIIEFTKYKVSLSFDSLRCDEPRNLNADEYCTISFGGSATLVSNGVSLGNDLVKIGISKSKIVAQTPIVINGEKEWLEPLEIPSGSNADLQVNQLLSNKFITNTHTDNLSLTLQYTFVCDRTSPLLNQWFKYARYGTQGTNTNNYSNGVTPNMIYEVQEVWSSWGDIEIETFNAKIIESIDIENTESDTISITIPLQIQGDNN